MLARKKYGCIARVRVHVHVRSHARETTIALNAGGSARVHSGDLHCGGLRASAARPDRSRQRSSLRGAERDQTRDNETHNRRQNQENSRRRRGGRVFTARPPWLKNWSFLAEQRICARNGRQANRARAAALRNIPLYSRSRTPAGRLGIRPAGHASSAKTAALLCALSHIILFCVVPSLKRCPCLVGIDTQLDFVGRHFEPYLTAGCVCTRRLCGVAWDAVPEQTWLTKL